MESYLQSQSEEPTEPECSFYPNLNCDNGQSLQVMSPYQLRNGASEGCEACSLLFALMVQLTIGQLEEDSPAYPENPRGLTLRRNELYYLRPSVVLHIWKAKTMYLLYTLKGTYKPPQDGVPQGCPAPAWRRPAGISHGPGGIATTPTIEGVLEAPFQPCTGEARRPGGC